LVWIEASIQSAAKLLIKAYAKLRKRRILAGKNQPDSQTAALAIIQGNSPAMRFHNFTRQGQTQTRAVTLG
jgi:hypothetical protein